MRGRCSTLAAGLLLIAAAGPATADWLLMKDGSRVETKGPWEVRSSQVVFTLPNGTLAAVRTAQVDFEGSARITAEAKAPKPAPTPPPKRESVLRLTDADLAHVEPAATAAAAGETAPASADADTAAAAPAADAAADLEVAAWASRYDVESAQTVLTGTVRNNGETLAYNLKVTVTALGPDGSQLAKGDARVQSPGLRAHGTAAFELTLSGNLEITDAKFALSAERVAVRSGPGPEPEATPDPPRSTLTQPPGQRLVIEGWRSEPNAATDSITLIGEVVNRSAEVAYDSSLEVTLKGPDGKPVAIAQALLGSRTLQPGEKTNFRVTFPGVDSYQDVAFQAKHNVRLPITRSVPARPGR